VKLLLFRFCSNHSILLIVLQKIIVCHNIQFLNYKNINTSKGNNYFILHIPNKLNDPDGSKISIFDRYTRTIDAINNNINNQKIEIKPVKTNILKDIN